MGNKPPIPHYNDLYDLDSGIDSDEGKNTNIRTHKKYCKKNSGKDDFIKYYSVPEKNDLKDKSDSDDEKLLSKKYKSCKNNSNTKWDYCEDFDNGKVIYRPPLKSQEHIKMTVMSDPQESKWTDCTDTDSDRSSTQLYEVELTASDDDDSSVLELVIPVNEKLYTKSCVPDVLCYCCAQQINLYVFGVR